MMPPVPGREDLGGGFSIRYSAWGGSAWGGSHVMAVVQHQHGVIAHGGGGTAEEARRSALLMLREFHAAIGKVIADESARFEGAETALRALADQRERESAG